MEAQIDLTHLLQNLNPVLESGRFVFITLPDAVYGDAAERNPVASIRESEGLTLVIPKSAADEAGDCYDGVFRLLTLQVHSSLHAVGLTAAVAGALAFHGISANLLAGFRHDHLLVPESRAEESLAVLQRLSTSRSESEPNLGQSDSVRGKESGE